MTTLTGCSDNTELQFQSVIFVVIPKLDVSVRLCMSNAATVVLVLAHARQLGFMSNIVLNIFLLCLIVFPAYLRPRF